MTDFDTKCRNVSCKSGLEFDKHLLCSVCYAEIQTRPEFQSIKLEYQAACEVVNADTSLDEINRIGLLDGKRYAFEMEAAYLYKELAKDEHTEKKDER